MPITFWKRNNDWNIFHKIHKTFFFFPDETAKEEQREEGEGTVHVLKGFVIAAAGRRSLQTCELY